MGNYVRSALRRAGCALWGHAVDNRTLRAEAGPRRCRCGAPYLFDDGRTTHMRHTLSCFLRHHTYALLSERDGVREYVCIRCGHPLVFPRGADRFAGRSVFPKKVRYACGLLGHRVTAVATRDGFTEYACHCGHSFLTRRTQNGTIRHPLVCVLTAHRIRYLVSRGGYAEYVCVDCGHPFCFAAGPAGRPAHELTA